MDTTFAIILTLFCVGHIHCKEECLSVRTHIFDVEANAKYSFSAEIKELGGLVIDINYENLKNDRIKLSSKESFEFIFNGIKHIKNPLDSLINEGWQDIDVNIANNTLNVICTSSQMSPLAISILPSIKSIKVSSENLKICEESCNIENSIQKIINNEERFKMTAFIAPNYPITFKIRHSVEEETFAYLEIKPRDCYFTWKDTNRSVPCGHINSGWNKFDIYINRTTIAINNHIIPVDGSLKTINIDGDYLVNCTKGMPIWKVTKHEEIPIPITTGQEIGFIITSTVSFSPVFKLDGIKMTLNWDNGLKIGSSGDPLKPKRYHIIFETSSESMIIYNEKKNDVLMELKFKKVPEFISVSSNKGEYRLALSVENLVHLPTNSAQTAPVTEPISTSPPLNPIVITISVLTPIVIVVIVIIIWRKIKKINKKTNEKVKMDPQNNEELEAFVNKTPSSNSSLSSPITTDSQYNEEREVVFVNKTPSSSSSRSSPITSREYINDLITATVHTPPKIKDVQGDTHASRSQDEIKSEAIDMRLKDFGKNKTVTQVMEDLENIIDSIFKAIKSKQLYGINSADSLLRDHGLPGTVRDNHGNSLLHYLILPIEQDNQTYWVNADDLKKFLKDHKVFVNAENYIGQTPLHSMVIEASKAYSIEEWKSIAQLLLDVGCDPRVHDNNGQLPEDIALYRGCIYLQDLLKKSRIDKGEIMMKLKIEQWPKLLEGTKQNDIESVRHLLLDNVPILPLSSSSDPLREAIQRGNIELTMLLLSAGVPLCGRPLVGLNSLEVSHATPGLTVFLPALIRREFYNCLRSESQIIINNDCDLVQLKQAVISLSETVKENGYEKTNWIFSSESVDINERSNEARKMLRLAASKGMGLTCQMLGLENVFLHPLPLEISPDNDAKPNSLIIFCRDLDLSLSLKEGNIPSQLKDEYEEYNFKKLRDFCKKECINFNSLHDKQFPVNKKVLKYIAEQGLDIIYKKIFRPRNGELVNLIIDSSTGFTMLHSAAYSGRMGMVEYLLFNKADERAKTKNGFTAAHVAAMRGHKECMEYILAFSKLNKSLMNDQTNSGLTAHQISNSYASEVNNLAKFLLHINVSYSILSEPKIKDKVKLVLNEKKSIIKDCLSKGSLNHIISSSYLKDQSNIWQQLKEESENFIQRLIEIDPRFNGKPITPYRNEDALELLLMDTYQIYLEIDNYEYWQEKKLHEAFIESGNKALQEYTVKSRNLCLSKALKPTVIGANLFVSYCSKEITTHISIHVIPVFKSELNLNTEGLHLSQIFQDTAQDSVTHITFTSSGKWSYITVDIEKQLFVKVDNSKMLVFSVCRFIKKILYPHWWFPRLQTRRHGRQWHHNAVSLQSVSERLLISSFLLEVFKVPEEKWENSSTLDRVLGVFKQMKMQVKNEEIVTNCFLDPGKEDIKVSSNILVIIDFLEEMKK